ncbi:DUF2064 domain-containing protein [uncultured Algimonas sp.]|uniref:TIGR04282 family arsenosugar biosynthesis glycosyltransferase n=1 Tax=uncultured Algimonas sp. TaxID=1547920 RepID=UPI002626D61D|nr:DUF2064 domain-containing protein [uncultured Algimonas sp.]
MTPDLYVFAKRPAMGAAKTRLARDIGPAHAQRLYRAMTARILRQVRDPRWNTVVYAAPANAIGTVPAWDGFDQRPQPGGSLSPRLAAAFSGPRRPVLVIGTDCPQVGARDIADALAALRRAPFVFGPARDGGFWLMGAVAPLPPGTFDGVRWSSEHTLADLEARLDGPIARLRTLSDVDDAQGLAAWRAGRH